LGYSLITTRHGITSKKESHVNVSLVLTVIGPDRPGLVESVSQAIAQQEGNWLESRMARMAGQFAGILRVNIDEGKADALRNDLMALETKGILINVETSTAKEGYESELRPLTLSLVGNDRPGIIHEISQILAQSGVNVDELTTAQSVAPMSGESLFHANAELRAPLDLNVEDLREQLEAIAQDLMVDIRLDVSS
jgi:glycine cleavage system regulatory protein